MFLTKGPGSSGSSTGMLGESKLDVILVFWEVISELSMLFNSGVEETVILSINLASKKTNVTNVASKIRTEDNPYDNSMILVELNLNHEGKFFEIEV